jgi:hypothetical protein
MFAQMKMGCFDEGSYTLRLKMDFESGMLCLFVRSLFGSVVRCNEMIRTGIVSGREREVV